MRITFTCIAKWCHQVLRAFELFGFEVKHTLVFLWFALDVVTHGSLCNKIYGVWCRSICVNFNQAALRAKHHTSMHCIPCFKSVSQLWGPFISFCVGVFIYFFVCLWVLSVASDQKRHTQWLAGAAQYLWGLYFTNLLRVVVEPVMLVVVVVVVVAGGGSGAAAAAVVIMCQSC